MHTLELWSVKTVSLLSYSMYHHFYKHKITILNIHIDPNAAKLSNADAGANAFADDAAEASRTQAFPQ